MPPEHQEPIPAELVNFVYAYIRLRLPFELKGDLALRELLQRSVHERIRERRLEHDSWAQIDRKKVNLVKSVLDEGSLHPEAAAEHAAVATELDRVTKRDRATRVKKALRQAALHIRSVALARGGSHEDLAAVDLMDSWIDHAEKGRLRCPCDLPRLHQLPLDGDAAERVWMRVFMRGRDDLRGFGHSDLG